MKVLGVDLGSFSVKIAELDVTAKGYTLTGFFEYPLSLDPQKDRNLEVIEILRRVSSAADSNNTKWVVAVPQNRVSVHQKTFPFRERPKIQKSLAFELEDDIPLDIDDTIFDAKVTETQGQLAEILTVASPKDAIQEVLSLCKDGGFDPDIVSVEGLALANMFENWELPPPERTAPLSTEATMVSNLGSNSRIVLQMGHQRSNLLVYKGDILISVRSILWGGAEISEGIARAFSVPIYEAVKMLHTKGAILMNSNGANKEQVALSISIAGSVDTLMRELRLTLLEVRAAHQLEFGKMELTGGVSQIQNLGAYITQSLEIPVNAAHPLQTIRQSRVENSVKLEATAALAVGLAIEGIKRPRNPAINLRREDFARENLSLKRFWETWKVPVQVATAMFVIFFVYVVVRDSMAASLVLAAEERVAELASKVAGLRGANASEAGVARYITTQQKLVKDREALKDTETLNSALDILTSLSERLPVIIPARPGQGLEVFMLNVDGNDLVIEGRVQGPTGIAVVQDALAKIARAKSVQKISPSSVPAGPGTPFGFRMKIERSK
ncbi:MAG: type II secretion system protein GspL [Bdellovibrionota bacterium]